MNGRYLLDTNIIIALFASEASVIESLVQANEVFIPTVALGELHYGARKSGRPQENLKRIEEFVSNSAVIGCDAKTARRYGEIKNMLRVKGRPLPENDVWIATLALQHSLTLVTRDAHFQEVEYLSTIVW
jgi:tRNA(fMet)-specific endonuclease VapC